MVSPYGASRSHSLDTPLLVGILWTSDQSVAEGSICQYATLTWEKYSFPASERKQSHALGSAATGMNVNYTKPYIRQVATEKFEVSWYKGLKPANQQNISQNQYT
jgi:hypothetical protein